MNVARLFVGPSHDGTLTNVLSASGSITRTAREFGRNVAALCASFRDLGVGPRDIMLIVGGSRIEIAEAIVASFNTGAIAAPLSPLLGARTIIDIAERLRPRYCVLEDVPDESVPKALAAFGTELICVKTRGISKPGWLHYQDLIAGPDQPLSFLPFADDHPALMIHGSGSTGAPKCISMTHGSVLRFFEHHRFVWSQYLDGPGMMRCRTPIVSALPLAHLAGLGLCLQGLMDSRPTFVMSLFLPDVFLKLVEETRCSVILLIPSLFRALLAEPSLERMDKSALEFCIAGGEPCPDHLAERIERAFRVPLVEAYSMTECMSGIGHNRHDLFSKRLRRHSCGKQLFGEASLRDAQGREQQDYGELWVRNATVHECYVEAHRNDASLKDGWFRTGDLFTKDADGHFFHRGRADDMFICHGKNVYPLEVELLLMTHPAVESACVAPIQREGEGPVAAAAVVARRRVDQADIQSFCARKGASHAVPRRVVQIDSMPLLGPGKIDRATVSKLLQQAYDEASLPVSGPADGRSMTGDAV